jgi:hypothetical protein
MYNVLGQKVVALVNERQEAGYHLLTWDIHQTGNQVSSGLYFLHFRVKNASGRRFVKNIKMLLLK